MNGLFDCKIFDPNIFGPCRIPAIVDGGAAFPKGTPKKSGRLFIEVALPINGFDMEMSFGKMKAEGKINEDEELLAILLNI